MKSTDTWADEVRTACEPETVAELFCYVPTRERRLELQQFLSDWEQINGPADLTKRYTSMLPIEQQEFLLRTDSKRYWSGLPPFLQEFLRGKMQLAAKRGELDNTPDDMLALYMTGQMTINKGERQSR